MDFIQNIAGTTELSFLKSNAWMIGLSILLALQWVVIQGLLLHYYYFRKNLKQPRPDGIRLSMAEQTIALQTEQLSKIYDKLAALTREVDLLAERSSRIATKQATTPTASASLEASFASMGELNLRKRLAEIQNN